MYKIKKQNKKAWIRIMEAFIAIAIIFTVTILVYSKTARKIDREEEIMNLEKIILDEIAHNNKVRSWVLEEKVYEVYKYIDENKRIPVFLDFNITICDLDKICNPVYKEGKEIYVEEIVISATLEDYGPKKLSLFVWEK